MNVTLNDVYIGKSMTIEHTRKRTCDKCEGKGGENVKTCTKCKGRGIVIKMV